MLKEYVILTLENHTHNLAKLKILCILQPMICSLAYVLDKTCPRIFTEEEINCYLIVS